MNVFGRIVKRYELPLDAVQELNEKYEEHKTKLNSFGRRLAGRLDSELEFTNLIGETKISKNIVDCMNDYIETLEKIEISTGGRCCFHIIYKFDPGKGAQEICQKHLIKLSSTLF